MLMKIFAIYDSGVSTWQPPMFCPTRGHILRWWNEVCNESNSPFSKHPSDYVLFEIGSWDDDKCLFDLLLVPQKLGVAIEFVKPLSSLGSGERVAHQQSEA